MNSEHKEKKMKTIRGTRSSREEEDGKENIEPHD
jgi:hypothetical protein